jgi:phage terminase large subunit-like protein
LRDAFISLSKTDRLALAHFLAGRAAQWIEALQFDFNILAHPHQQAPRLATGGGDWTTWLILGGRGAGKTRAGAEWVRSLALADSKRASR